MVVAYEALNLPVVITVLSLFMLVASFCVSMMGTVRSASSLDESNALDRTPRSQVEVLDQVQRLAHFLLFGGLFALVVNTILAR